MIIAGRKAVHTPLRRPTRITALTPIGAEAERPARGAAMISDLWGTSPPFPYLSSPADVPRWMSHLYAVNTKEEPRAAVRVVLWTIDAILGEKNGPEILDGILASVDVARVSSGTIVALIRGTHRAHELLRSRWEFLWRARGRLLALGKASTVAGISDLVELGDDDGAASP